MGMFGNWGSAGEASAVSSIARSVSVESFMARGAAWEARVTMRVLSMFITNAG